MKRAIVMLTAISILASSVPVFAAEDDSYNVIGDVFIARPLGLAATVIGTAIYIVSLPLALTSGSQRQTADTLIRKPFAFTFKRQLGDFREEFGFRYDQALAEPDLQEPQQGGPAGGPNPEQGNQQPSQ
ncbi:MAG TPA: hypothetical protein VLD40_01330 [Dissulfurispiraceae bacterium]|nr:hypothetical protein [Dissulfurispiraceae bacterium]